MAGKKQKTDAEWFRRVLARRVRGAYAVSLKDVAREIGVAYSTLNRWASRDVPPIKLQQATRLADLLGCKVSDIFAEDAPPPMPHNPASREARMASARQSGRKKLAERLPGKRGITGRGGSAA